VAKKKSLRERLLEVLEDEGDDDDLGHEEDDTIVLRGPSARALLGLIGGEEKPPAGGEPGGEGEPAAEPAPQRTQSRYFGEGK
jgi:hypothetical protein